MLTFGSLFAGIGGFDLGFERAGMQCRWQVEIDPFCQAVLKNHWPEVGRWDDVRTFPPAPAEDWRVDVLCGGFPCQGISKAGKGLGIERDERSGLWVEFSRIVRILRPSYFVVENPSAILANGLHRVLGDISEGRFDAEWQAIPAASVGAPHLRDRVWILAYPGQFFRGTEGRTDTGQRRPYVFPKADNREATQWSEHRELVAMVPGIDSRVAENWWKSQSRMDRTSHGVSDWVDRFGAIGNSVCPQVAEWIGRRIIAAAT